MLNYCLALAMLLLESNEVVALRLAKFAKGEAIWDKAEIMISEKRRSAWICKGMRAEPARAVIPHLSPLH